MVVVVFCMSFSISSSKKAVYRLFVLTGYKQTLYHQSYRYISIIKMHDIKAYLEVLYSSTSCVCVVSLCREASVTQAAATSTTSVV